LTLASIPSDVIRNILSAGPESINEMKLISPRWNALALSRLSNRKNLPQIQCLEYFCWRIDSNYGKWSLRLPEKFRNCFGLRKWSAGFNNEVMLTEYVC
ncbi:hypothetical protein PMAYCL1PPCAC_05897, partial [Pristionchus mayeri]